MGNGMGTNTKLYDRPRLRLFPFFSFFFLGGGRLFCVSKCSTLFFILLFNPFYKPAIIYLSLFIDYTLHCLYVILSLFAVDDDDIVCGGGENETVCILVSKQRTWNITKSWNYCAVVLHFTEVPVRINSICISQPGNSMYHDIETEPSIRLSGGMDFGTYSTYASVTPRDMLPSHLQDTLFNIAIQARFSFVNIYETPHSASPYLTQTNHVLRTLFRVWHDMT